MVHPKTEKKFTFMSALGESNYESYIGLCKLENEIVKEAKNAQK